MDAVHWSARRREYISLEGGEKVYKNAEGYSDPTAGDAIRAAERVPKNIYEIYKATNTMLAISGLEITGLRDKRTKQEWRK